MKRVFAALLAALALCVPCAAEETALTVYVSSGSVPQEMAAQLVQLLQRAIPDAAFTAVYEAETGLSLRELVMRDEAPQLALCTAGEAAPWAEEGLLLALNTSLGDTQAVEPAVLQACLHGDRAFMTPLLARHRLMVVNRQKVEKMGFDHLLNPRDYPVWLPMQFAQVLEEAALAGETGMELWPVTPQESEGVLALIQALYHAPLLLENGRLSTADTGAAAAGVEWLADMVACGLIGMADSREEALGHFLTGKTALFIDWTEADAEALRAKGGAAQVLAMPHPSSSGLPVRSFEVVGAAAFATGDQRTDAIARAAAAVLMEDEQAQRLLGERAIYADGATWLYAFGPGGTGAALRGALCTAVASALAGEMSPQAAMRAVRAASDGL